MTTGTAVGDTHWTAVDDPAAVADAQYRSTPVDYPAAGPYEASDGRVADANLCHDLTYREMVEGIIADKPYQYEMQYDEKPTLEWLLTQIPVKYLRFYDPHDHAEGHPKPFDAIFRAHVLRLVKGWKHSTALHRYLKSEPFLVPKLGFEDIPDQSTLHRGWHDRLRHVQDAVEDAAEVLVEVARMHDIPAPDPGFLPEDIDDDADEETKESLAEEKAQEVWQQAKPFVDDCFKLDRGENTSIPEGAWWEQHAFMGMREDMYANDGARNFAIDSTRPVSPSGDSHRYQLKKLGVEDVRTMLQETTRMMVARARANDELTGRIMASIDITKDFPWTGQVERDSDGNLQEPWILGYNDGELHFQWAVIKIVGFDVPFFLDAVPVVRGRERADIVDDLLEGALSILPDIDLVMMDREFDHDPVKDVCAQHGVHYLNPARVWKHDRHAKQIRKMNEQDKDFAVVEQERIDDGPTRKAFYVPKREWEREDEGNDESPDEREGPRQEMLDDVLDLGADEDDFDAETEGRSPFEQLVAEVADEEDLDEPTDFDPPTVPFETNHPLLEADPDDEREMKHQIGRMMAKYKRRWGIENGFKTIKTFLCRTTSDDHRYRYFNFAFACVLYNCWRIVDLLVQLSIKDEPEYSPEITANTFLTIAKQYYGLDPPD